MPRCQDCRAFEADCLHPSRGACQNLAAAVEKAFGVRLAGSPAIRSESRPCPAYAPAPEEDDLPGDGVPPGRLVDPFAAPPPPGDTVDAGVRYRRRR